MQSHAVTPAAIEHLFFAQPGEFPHMPKAKPRPEFPDTTGHQIRVFIQIGGGGERANFGWITEALQVERLALCDFREHAANVVPISPIQLLEPFQTMRQRFEKRSLGRILLQRRERRDKIGNRTNGNRARWMGDPNG